MTSTSTMLRRNPRPISNLKLTRCLFSQPCSNIRAHSNINSAPRASANFATVSDSIIARPPPGFEELKVRPPVPPLLDRRILQAASRQHRSSLPHLVNQYIHSAGTILDVSLPYESRPAEDRKPDMRSGVYDAARNVVTVAHCLENEGEHKITISSGFALNAKRRNAERDETLILTCAHTLEEIRHSPLFVSETTKRPAKISGSFVLVGAGDNLHIYSVDEVVTALPRSDLLLLSCRIPKGAINPLPVSPYPVHRDTTIRAHFVQQQNPSEPGWNPWVGDTWGRWVRGKVLGYRDFAGREAEPGTYDSLSHMLFRPLPTVGSSGGPLVDEDSGSVVGVMLGSRMDNRIEGVRGWGVPSETIFEMFSLPGLEGKK